MDKTFAVIGLGTFGRQLCETLAEKGATVIAVDNDPSLVDRVKQIVTQAVLLDATDPDGLSGAPLEEVDVAIVAMGDSVEASILATALLKKLAVPYVVSRAISDLHQQVLRQVGADEVVNIEIDQGIRVANRLISPDVLDQFAISSEISVSELYVPQAIVGATLAALDLRNRYQVNVVSVKRNRVEVDEYGNPKRLEQILFPGPGDTFERDDTILVVGRNDDIERFKQL
ncbi:MAG: TrkA family potassium uptake protein [Spirochaetaceae bacterium]|nr:MAG: TrkA family potassium uptake protein [Spirochaetaceae bacterium]